MKSVIDMSDWIIGLFDGRYIAVHWDRIFQFPVLLLLGEVRTMGIQRILFFVFSFARVLALICTYHGYYE